MASAEKRPMLRVGTRFEAEPGRYAGEASP